MVDGEAPEASGRKMVRGLQCVGQKVLRHKTLIAVLVAVTFCTALLSEWTRPSKLPLWMDVKKCSPRNNIGFLKTHKCASSALQNILLRYGDKHNLIFALSDKGNYFGGKIPFHAGMMLSSPLNKLTPNIFALHTKWNYDEIKKVMPEDTLYFSIVREPTELFKSLFVFTKMDELLGLTMEQYIKTIPVDENRAFGYLGFNQMAWDFGMPLEDMTNLTATSELVRRADEQFGLVLVAERMEESLVLLAKYLCWELKDVLVLKLNSLRDEYKKTITMSEEVKQVLQQKLTPDYQLYQHFLERFEQQVEAFGRHRMAAAVDRLRELKALLESTCNFVSRDAKQLNGTQRPWSDMVDGFEGGGGGQCDLYTKPELTYIDVLRKRQYKKIVQKFGLPSGPPLDAIPLNMNNLKKTSQRKPRLNALLRSKFTRRNGRREQ